MRLALVGAHRTGKSTLAREFASSAGYEAVETNVSSVFAEMHINPSDTFNFSQRMNIQEAILLHLKKVYEAHDGADVIFDRSPLDMLAYLYAEAVGDRVSPFDQDRVTKYAEDCYKLTNRHFGCLVLVQPGIELVAAEGKAALNAAYMEHLNALMGGLFLDPRLDVINLIMSRSRLDIQDRIVCIHEAVDNVIENNSYQLYGAVIH